MNTINLILLKSDITKKQLNIKIPEWDKPRLVDLDKYISAKTKSLVEFGYKNLSEKTVLNELIAISNSKKVTVIGEFIKDDLYYIT